MKTSMPEHIFESDEVQQWLGDVEDILMNRLGPEWGELNDYAHLALAILEFEWEFWEDFKDFSTPLEAAEEELSCWEH